MKKIFSKKVKLITHRAILSDVVIDENPLLEDTLDFTFSFTLVNLLTQEKTDEFYKLTDTFYDMRARCFFDFLEKNKVRYTDYLDLIGLVADISICLTGDGEDLYVFEKLLAKPPKK